MIEVFGLWAEEYDGKQGGKLLLAEEGEKFLKLLDVYETGNSVSSLCVDRKRKLLFATLEVREQNGKTGGYIAQFSYENQKLKLLQKIESFGAYPISLMLFGQFAIVLNHGSTKNWILRTRTRENGSLEVYREYDEASLVLLQRKEDGGLGQVLDIYRFRGSGEIPFFQDAASPHSLNCYKEAGEFYIPERGSDRVRVFRIDVEGKKFKYVGKVSGKKGYGPRNITFSKNGETIYVLNEIEPVISVYRRKKRENGTVHFEFLQEVRTIPQGVEEKFPFDKESFQAPHPVDICMNEDSTALYCLTRSSNTLTKYQVSGGGMLHMEKYVALFGENPRQLFLESGGIYALTMNPGMLEKWENGRHITCELPQKLIQNNLAVVLRQI